MRPSFPGSTASSSEQRTVSGIRQFPLLPTAYIAALPSPPKTRPSEQENWLKGSPKASSQIPLPPGWKSHIHPNGWIYYSNPEAKIVTDYKMEYQLGQQEFESAMKEVDAYPVDRLPAHCEMWIDYRLEQGTQVAEKVFVDHEKRRLSSRLPVHRGALHPDGTWQDDELDVRQQLTYEETYWEYIVNHPCHAALPSNAEEDVIAALVWYSQDRLLNTEDSIVPYSKELSKDLLDMFSFMSGNKETFTSPRNGYVRTHLVASVLERVSGERLRQHYGQQDARNFIKRTHKARQEFPQDPQAPLVSYVFDFCMTFFCFGAPYAYLRQINEFFMTGIGRTDTITARWQAFVDENVADWTNTNLVATVLVSASVALLAIPGIDSTTRCLGIISTLLSIASIIAGLLNVWQHQHKSRTNLELTVIFDFFSQAERLVKTDKLLALLLSLPMVGLIWAALVFAASMVTFAWRGVDTTFVNSGSASGSGSEDGATKFGPATAWATTGLTAFLTVTVLSSFLYFWRAWKPSNVHKKRK